MKLRKFLAVLMLLLLSGVQAPVWADPDPSFRWDFTGHDIIGGNDFPVMGVPGSPAVGDDGTIYAGSINGYFFAVDPNGWLKWVNNDFDGAFGWAPAIADNGVIYANNAQRLLALHPDFGWVQWFSEPVCHYWGAPAIGQDGTVYVGSDQGRLYAFTYELEKKWEYTGTVDSDQPGRWSTFSNPVIGLDGTIYCVRIGGRWDSSESLYKDSAELHALRPDGSPIWVVTDNDLALPVPPVSPAIAGGRIYVASEAGRLRSFHTSDGTSSGTSPLMNWTGDVSGGPVIGAFGRVYVPNVDTLFAFPPNLTEPLWSWDSNSDITTPGLTISTPAVGADGRIYFGAWGNLAGTVPTGDIYVLNSDGTYYWGSGLLVGQIHSSPAIVPSGNQGVLYIGLEGAVRALNVDAPGLTISPWPCDRANLKRNARAAYSLIEALRDLKRAVMIYNFPHNFGNSLDSKLSAAIQSLEKEKVAPAKNQLGAFINEVTALRAKKIVARDADRLITSAQQIRDFL